MMNFFTSTVTKCKDIAGKLRLVSAFAGGVLTENRQLMQQRGLVSVPVAGDPIIYLRLGNMVIGIASDSADRPSVAEGEAALYGSAQCYVLVRPDGSIEIKAPKDVTILGNLKCTGDVSDSVGALSALRAKHNTHTHVGNLGAPTSPTMPAGQDNGGASA